MLISYSSESMFPVVNAKMKVKTTKLAATAVIVKGGNNVNAHRTNKNDNLEKCNTYFISKDMEVYLVIIH